MPIAQSATHFNIAKNEFVNDTELVFNGNEIKPDEIETVFFFFCIVLKFSSII